MIGWLPRWFPRAATAVLAVAGLTLAILIMVGSVDANAGLAGAGIGLVCLLLIVFAALPPADLDKYLGRVKTVSLGSLGVELSDYEKLAKQKEEANDGEETLGGTDAEEDASVGESLLALRLRLEAKLTYLAKHVLAPQPNPNELIPTFLSIGSLDRDGLLDKQQARIAEDILTMREFEFRHLREGDKRLFLDGATEFVDVVRIEVLNKQLIQTLEASGWRVLRAARPPARRRDLLIQSTGDRHQIQHHAIPVFVEGSDSDLLDVPRRRLEEKPETLGGGRRFLVVPPLAADGPETGGEIEIVSIDQLMTCIEEG